MLWYQVMQSHLFCSIIWLPICSKYISVNPELINVYISLLHWEWINTLLGLFLSLCCVRVICFRLDCELHNYCWRVLMFIAAFVFGNMNESVMHVVTRDRYLHLWDRIRVLTLCRILVSPVSLICICLLGKSVQKYMPSPKSQVENQRWQLLQMIAHAAYGPYAQIAHSSLELPEGDPFKGKPIKRPTTPFSSAAETNSFCFKACNWVLQ